MADYSMHRKRLVEWVRSQLTGAVSEDGRRLGICTPGRDVDPEKECQILKGMSPYERYPVGVLYPVFKGEEGIDPASETEPEIENDEELNEDDTDQSAKAASCMRRYVPPSSVGFSFYVCSEKVEFQVLCSAVRYIAGAERDKEGRYISTEWHREALVDSQGEYDVYPFSSPKKDTRGNSFNERVTVLKESAKVDILWRPFKEGWLVTVSLFNSRELRAEGRLNDIVNERNTNSLFEVELKCLIDHGEVGKYPHVNMNLLTEEEQELELQYKDNCIYAVGHGAAVNWKLKNGKEGQSAHEIWRDFFPAVEVPQFTANVGCEDDPVLQMKHLCLVDKKDNKVLDDLGRFVESYAKWVINQKSEIDAIPAEKKNAANRIVKRMDVAVYRMQKGVSLLRNDSLAAKSFSLANQAMIDQMVQGDRINKKSTSSDQYRWRPFQLAFLLLTIESTINADSDDRDIVDLIWFPTGGGKTEAYLGLIAFLIIWRRLKYKTSGNGTTVLMRYTLRLLTRQQYTRAARMICALELLRSEKPELGNTPITIGLWVGNAASPNTFAVAQKAVEDAAQGDKRDAAMYLVIEKCPWCGHEFDAPLNYKMSSTEFRFACTNPNCEIGKIDHGLIPCNVVDEALYKDPPTLLIATIDKFARLTWEDRANSFFGKNGNRPPELVIQDELHLVAGALGSVAGLYEAAVDTALIKRGVHPKYIASTATIKMAQEQVRRLYGRELAIFPPPGLSCKDSYFARAVDLSTKPGRLYVGYLAPMLNRQKCMAPLAAALLLAPDILFASQQDQEELMEAWWTQIIYHGSLKGVGSSHNSFEINVRDYLDRYSKEIEAAKRKMNGRLSSLKIAQLTSNCTAEENANTFSCLEKKYQNNDCLDAVLATNMISVGLDVSRLALMIINGQPLTTAEYIQASSRIGRGDVPGIVFANYYRDQARSLSHYENFRPYHESFYRFVEPTSVTPYTYQARSRALHAALIIAVRHSCDFLLADSNASLFDPENEHVKTVITELKKRCCQADKAHQSEIVDHIDRIVGEWKNEIIQCNKTRRQLNYQSNNNDNSTNRLIHSHGDKIKGLWPTLQSMRNVERSALLKTL